MIDQSLAFESSRIDLKNKYAKEFQKAGLSSLTVAKYMQLEHRLDLLVDMENRFRASSFVDQVEQSTSGKAVERLIKNDALTLGALFKG